MNIFLSRALAGLVALATSGLTYATPDSETATAKAPMETEDPFPAEERVRLQARAKDLKQQARVIRDKADAARAEANSLCWQRTLVSACFEEADEARRQSITAARKLELEAGDIERDMRTRAAEVRRAEKLRNAEERQNKSIEMSVKTRETEQRKDEKRALDAAERERKDAEAAARAPQDAQEAAERDARLAAKRKREDAQAAERAADQQRRAAKIDERIRKREEERARREAEAAAKAAGNH